MARLLLLWALPGAVVRSFDVVREMMCPSNFVGFIEDVIGDSTTHQGG
jgi:hypothetical protein